MGEQRRQHLRRVGVHHRVRHAVASVLMVGTVAGTGLAGSAELAGMAWLAHQPRKHADPAARSRIGPGAVDVAFRSRDGNLLRGWLYRASGGPATGARPLVIFAHGWHEERSADGIPVVAHHLLATGRDVLLFDRGGDGDSQGAWDSLAAEDILGAYEWAVQSGYSATRLAFIGYSGGGSAIDMALPQMPDVAGVVDDSAFASVSTIIGEHISLPGPLQELTEVLGTVAARPLGFQRGPSPSDGVHSYNGPVMVIQGTADGSVGLQDAEQLRAASPNASSVLLLVPGAGHVSSLWVDQHAYLSRLTAFLDHCQPVSLTAGAHLS